jgi:hypothetical protein
MRRIEILGGPRDGEELMLPDEVDRVNFAILNPVSFYPSDADTKPTAPLHKTIAIPVQKGIRKSPSGGTIPYYFIRWPK